MITYDTENKNKQFIHMFQYNVSHVSRPCCHFIIATLLPYGHVSEYESFMLHSHVALLFTTIKHETYPVEIVAHACFSNNGMMTYIMHMFMK